MHPQQVALIAEHSTGFESRSMVVVRGLKPSNKSVVCSQENSINLFGFASKIKS